MSLFILTSLFYTGVYASVPRSLNFSAAVGPDGKCFEKGRSSDQAYQQRIGPWNALVQIVSWPQQVCAKQTV